MLATLTEKLRLGHELTSSDVVTACEALLDENVKLSERADFLRALHAKGETPAEVAAFVDVLLTRGRQAVLGPCLLDVCGTGGDRAGIFNVSTGVMFVATACGARVVKHGNRGITSKCGGADVLEALGVRVDLSPETALEAAGCCFLSSGVQSDRARAQDAGRGGKRDYFQPARTAAESGTTGVSIGRCF